MKKLMTVLLGLSFVLGTASFAFGDDKPTTKEKSTTKTKKAKKKPAAETK